jgi:hypothetical protein
MGFVQSLNQSQTGLHKDQFKLVITSLDQSFGHQSPLEMTKIELKATNYLLEDGDHV